MKDTNKPNVYGYIQCTKNPEAITLQKESIILFAKHNNLNVQEYFESNQTPLEKKLNRLKKGDTLIVSNLYRFGMNISEVLEKISCLIEKGVVIYSAQDDLKIGDELTNPIMMYCFDLVAKLAKEQKGQQTKEGLDLRRKSGQTLGRPKGLKNKNTKLNGAESKIEALLNKGYTKTKISKMLGVSRVTLHNFLTTQKTEKEDVYA